jgi:hypothetical protein
LIEGQPAHDSPDSESFKDEQELAPPVKGIKLQDQSDSDLDGLVELGQFVGLPATASRLREIQIEVSAQLGRIWKTRAIHATMVP